MTARVVDLMCREVVELVTEYFSLAMPPDDQVRMERHLLACPPCTAYVEQVRTTAALVRGLHGDGRSVSVSEALLREYRRLNGE